jgi:hypothetical protein
MMTYVASRLAGRLTQTAAAGWQVQVRSKQIVYEMISESKVIHDWVIRTAASSRRTGTTAVVETEAGR